MKEIAKAKGLPYDKRVYYPDKMIKALVEMEPNAGERLPTCLCREDSVNYGKSPKLYCGD
jgi:hypothetical protein